MKALKVTEHVLRMLAALEASAVEDYVDALDAGRLAVGAVLGQRADLWRELAQVASLLDRDRDFSSFVADALLRDTDVALPVRYATGAAPARGAEGEKCDRGCYGVIRADGLCPRCDQRAAALADARQLLDLLEATPELPLDKHTIRFSAHTSGTDDEKRAGVDAAATILGTPIKDSLDRGGHYETTLAVGLIEYTVVAVMDPSMVRYHQVLKLGEAAVATIEAADVQDEDQPVPPPAAPARGHAPGDVGKEPDAIEEALAAGYSAEQLDGTACLSCGRQFAVEEASVPAVPLIGGRQLFAHFNCLTDDELAAALLDEDAPATHSPGADGTPRCHDTEPDPVFSNMPTCPTCSSLRAADRADTNPGDTQ